MTEPTDWARLRGTWAAEGTAPPPGWPPGVHPVSLEGLAFIGVDPRTGALYWDGKPVEVVRPIRLGTIERRAVILGGLGAATAGLVELVRLLAALAGSPVG